jgi:hypothetical protein
MSEPMRCQATNQSGQPCSAAHYRDGFCRWHHPDLGEQRKAWAAKGGRNGSQSARAKRKLATALQDLTGVKAMLLESMEQTKNGEMEPGILTALSTAARAVVAVAGVADFEGQLAEMRRELADLSERSAS